MHELYPLTTAKFGDCRKESFVITEGGTLLQSNSTDRHEYYCSGHAIYADLGKYSEIGFNEGVY